LAAARSIALVELWEVLYQRWQARSRADGVDGLLHDASPAPPQVATTMQVIEPVVRERFPIRPAETTHRTNRAMRTPPGSTSAVCRDLARVALLRPSSCRTTPSFPPRWQVSFDSSGDPPRHAMVKNFTGDASIRKSTAGRGLADPKGEDGSVGLLNFVGARPAGCGIDACRAAGRTPRGAPREPRRQPSPHYATACGGPSFWQRWTSVPPRLRPS
jgi:hypothetical protein